LAASGVDGVVLHVLAGLHPGGRHGARGVRLDRARIVPAWWSKPLFERVPLWVLSRALFGDAPELQQVLRELPRLWLRRLPLALVWHRLHPSRAMMQPVALLEGSKHSERSERESLLTRQGGGVAFLVAILGVLAELALTAGLFLLVVLFTPKEFLPPLSPALHGPIRRLRARMVDLGAARVVVDRLLDHRTVERGLRLRAVPQSARAARGLGHRARLPAPRGAHPARWARRGGSRVGDRALSSAAHTREPRTRSLRTRPCRQVLPSVIRPKVATEIRARPEFGHEESQGHWRWKGDVSQSRSNVSLGFLGVLLEIFLWCAAIVVALVLLILIARAIGWVRWTRAPKPPPPPGAGHASVRTRSATRIAALTTSLAVRSSCGATDKRSRRWACSIRAAISRLMERDGLKLERSDTESDCLRRAKTLPDQERTSYFAAITRAWLVCAYSATRPATEAVEDLCRQWSAHFERRAA
jgi:hypothetical protein